MPHNDTSRILDQIRRDRQRSRGNTQGCGCLLILLGLPCLLFPPLGVFVLAVGLIVLIVGLCR